MTKQQASKANNARSNDFRGMAGLPGIFGVLRTSSQDADWPTSVNHALANKLLRASGSKYDTVISGPQNKNGTGRNACPTILG